jgi:hypothetical protein
LTIKGCLAVGDFVEVWCNLKGWYCSVEDRAPKACLETLASQMAERVELSTMPPPPRVVDAHQHDPNPCP